jgi:5-oxoprolinase (ATP-hydrolysing)
MQASILSNQRVHGPAGAMGGEPGLPGINHHRSAEGVVRVLLSNVFFEALADDAVEILTPGGGGYGKREST